MAQNRLHLDFSLQYSDERAEFLTQYLQAPQFVSCPPTAEESETMSNYLLWGKDRKTGLNAKQAGLCDIPTRSRDWSNDNDKCESLDALMESPTFNEAQVSSYAVYSAPPLIQRKKFSRDEALANCPEHLKSEFTSLFRRIDELDIKINYYEILHNRRNKPPREQLLNKFTPEERERYQEAVTHWNQFQYLKYRHQLVEMRRQQYTLRDNFMPIMQPIVQQYAQEPIAPPTFEAGIEVLPLGIWDKAYAPSRLWFRDLEDLNPTQYTEEELKIISDYYWEKQNYKPTTHSTYFDFRELEHVYELFQIYYDLDEITEAEDFMTTSPSFMSTLKFYIDLADLTELQREILHMKIDKKKNTDIAYEINHKWGKSYTSNYISTIFRQRIIPKINEAARHHEMIVSNLFFPEEFKTCTGCGKILLRDSINFTRKTRSKDGYTTRCKKCEKAARTKGDSQDD